jgi:hypothetical protein
MKSLQRGIMAGAGVAAALLLSGCATPENRAKENPAAFSKVPASQKKMVLAGKISKGMSRDAVFIALGKPSRKEPDEVDGQPLERWIYGRTYSHEVPRYRYRAVRDRSGNVFTIPEYEPVRDYQWADYLVVTFRGGKVVAWRQIPPPPGYW